MISIVIPCYNQHEMTVDCLSAIIANTSDFEIALIDNGSNPPLLPMIDGKYVVNRVRNDSNLGFPVAVNQGIRAAKGDVIVLLNNDVIVTPGALNRLADLLADYSITAPVANYCAGLQQEAVLPTYQTDKELYEVAKKWMEENAGRVREVNFAIGFCMAFRKSLFDEIGPFDETHWPCCGEEIDWCFRARMAGHKIAVACDVYVHHIGSQTFHAMEERGEVEYHHVCYRNDRYLEKKWGPGIWERQIGPMTGPVKQDDHAGKIRLNLGCGPYSLADFVNVDQDQELHPDLVADVRNLPYGSGTVDEIYAGHLLEHLDWDEGMAALRHWYSLLKIGGKIMLTTPDFDYLAKAYLANPTPENMRKMNDLYIYSYTQKSLHRYCYGPALLKAALVGVGFGDVERVPQSHPYCTSPMEDQITFRGVK